jgi:hypothetical protein
MGSLGNRIRSMLNQAKAGADGRTCLLQSLIYVAVCLANDVKVRRLACEVSAVLGAAGWDKVSVAAGDVNRTARVVHRDSAERLVHTRVRHGMTVVSTMAGGLGKALAGGGGGQGPLDGSQWPLGSACASGLLRT